MLIELCCSPVTHTLSACEPHLFVLRLWELSVTVSARGSPLLLLLQSHAWLWVCAGICQLNTYITTQLQPALTCGCVCVCSLAADKPMLCSNYCKWSTPQTSFQASSRDNRTTLHKPRVVRWDEPGRARLVLFAATPSAKLFIFLYMNILYKVNTCAYRAGLSR